MCGIAGKIYLNRNRINEEQLKAMSGKIAHRGPDDRGTYISPDRKVGLVSRRLAIVDLTKAGHQPMSYLNRYWITYNGEVYNFPELKADLVKQGYKFSSGTDTEVILALYAKYQDKCVGYLRGMWALAIYDSKENTVFLSRDRLGKKPLKYYHQNGVFIFASELKAILTQPEIIKQPDWLAIHHYLTLGYCPAPFTGFKQLFKLEPGHNLKINLRTGRVTKHQYWKLDYNHQLDLSEREWTEKILETVEKATKIRMLADVPIGAFLSGGVDSSAVVAMMAKNSNKPIKTYTIGFAEKDYNETAYAKTISDQFHTNHTVLVAKPQSVDILPELAEAYEEPFADSSAVITYMVSKLARKHVTVILNGDGGDENFSGYAHHIRLARDLWFKNNPWAYQLSQPIAKLWPKAARFLDKQKMDIRSKYLGYKTYFTKIEKNRLYQHPLLPKNLDNASQDWFLQRCKEAGTPNIADQLLYTDMTSYFPDDLLTKVDIASMRVGLEARSPLTDHKLVELAAQIPFSLKVHRGETKYIFKKALEGLLPYENLYRPKMGFSIPLSKWFTKELKPYALAQLMKDKSILKEIFKSEEVIGMLHRHSETIDFGPKLWSLLMLQLWWKKYFA